MPMRRVDTRLVAAFEGKMGGDHGAILEDADLIGADWTLRIRRRVVTGTLKRLPATLTMPSCETRRSSLRTAR